MSLVPLNAYASMSLTQLKSSSTAHVKSLSSGTHGKMVDVICNNILDSLLPPTKCRYTIGTKAGSNANSWPLVVLNWTTEAPALCFDKHAIVST